MDWKQLLISITSSVDEELRLRNAYLDVHFVNPSSVFLLDKGRHLGACSRNVTAYFPPTR